MPALKGNKEKYVNGVKSKCKIHYIYKIYFLCGGAQNRYYIGRRST